MLIRDYIEPARPRQDIVTIRSCDVRAQMGLSQHLPAVCSVLASDTFEKGARVRRRSIDGPLTAARRSSYSSPAEAGGA